MRHVSLSAPCGPIQSVLLTSGTLGAAEHEYMYSGEVVETIELELIATSKRDAELVITPIITIASITLRYM